MSDLHWVYDLFGLDECGGAQFGPDCKHKTVSSAMEAQASADKLIRNIKVFEWLRGNPHGVPPENLTDDQGC